MKYSIDTSAIVDVWKGAYPPDIFPDLPDMLSEMVSNGDLRASDEVLVELEKKLTEAYQWAKRHREMFCTMDEQIQIEAANILSVHRNLVKEKPQRGRADVFVIALAKINGCAVVTSEKATNNPHKPNIPDICNALGIRSVSLLDLFREQGWVFHFASPRKTR